MTTTTSKTAASNVVALKRPANGVPGGGDARLGVVAALVTGALALAALDEGLYDFTRWGLMAAAMLAILAGLLIAGRIQTLGVLGATVLALTALAGWAAASMTWADSADRAWTETNRLVLYTAVLAICVATLRRRRDVHRCLAIVAVVIAGAALWTVVLLLRGDPSAFLDHRLDTPVGYINGTAGLFLMGLWPLTSLSERAGNPLIAGAAIALAVVEANLLLLTQSRAIVPALLVSTCLVVALYPGRTARVWTLLFIAAGAAAASPWALAVYADRVAGRPRAVPADLAQAAGLAALGAALVSGALWAAVTVGRRAWTGERARRAAAAAAGVLLCVVAAAAIAAGDPFGRVQTQWRAFTTLQVDETSSTRFTGAGGYRYDLWRVALDDVRREPLLGVGAGSYGLSYYQQRHQDENVRQPHSLPLQVAAELGLIGVVLALVAFAAAAWAVVRNRRVSVAAGVAGTGMAAAWATQASIDWLYNLPGLTMIAIVAIVAACGPTARVPAAAAGRPRRLIWIGAALAIAVAAASLGRQYSADVYAERAHDALTRKPFLALRESAASLKLNPYAMETYYTRAAAYARRDDYARAQHTLMLAAAREPLNFVPWALMGDLAVRRGEIAVARRSYGHALALNPREDALRDLATKPRRATR